MPLGAINRSWIPEMHLSRVDRRPSGSEDDVAHALSNLKTLHKFCSYSVIDYRMVNGEEP